MRRFFLFSPTYYLGIILSQNNISISPISGDVLSLGIYVVIALLYNTVMLSSNLSLDSLSLDGILQNQTRWSHHLTHITWIMWNITPTKHHLRVGFCSLHWASPMLVLKRTERTGKIRWLTSWYWSNKYDLEGWV